jgi:hypothetical protein
MRLSLLSAIFAAALTVAPGFAQNDCDVVPDFTPSDCDHPRDFAENARCFLGASPCEYFFFGIDRPPDYGKALTCCEASESWPFIALMYLNGDGTPRNLPKAEAVLRAWRQKDGNEFNDDQAATLQTVINECQRGGLKSCRRVDYCADLARNTLDLNTCAAVDEVRAEAKLRAKMVQVRSSLNVKDRARFDRVVAAFEAYELQEMRRGYAATADGTARDLAGLDQAAFARNNFLKLVRQTVESRGLESANADVYRRTDDELGRIYRDDIRETVAAWQDDLTDPGLPKDIVQRDQSYIADYQSAAHESQLAWFKFRDSYAQLADLLYQETAGVLDPGRSARTELTKLRIAELRHEPLEATSASAPRVERD